MTEIQLAEALARVAHARQRDKAGRPYIEHVARVVAEVEGDDAKVVAWLHDVVEDCPWFTDHQDDMLREIGFKEANVQRVLRLTRGWAISKRPEDYSHYIDDVAPTVLL
jgi:(p)ppGpp synthase/HD superfamily hydrolase